MSTEDESAPVPLVFHRGKLNEEEVAWVRIAIKAQAQRVRLRQAIIEKTLTGLVWAGVVGIGLMVVEWLKFKFGVKA